MEQQNLPKKQTSTTKKIILFGCLPLIILGGICAVIMTTCTVSAVKVIDETVKAVDKNIKEEQQAFQQKIDALAITPESDIQPDGELNLIYSFGSDYTDLQRENKEKEIKDKIVKWTLKVYEVDTTLDKKGYKIQTSDTGKVGTFIYIYSPSDEDIKIIEALKTGDTVTVKGYIKGVSMRNIQLDPAILVKE